MHGAYSRKYCPAELLDVPDLSRGFNGREQLWQLGSPLSPTQTWAEFGVGSGASAKGFGELLSKDERTSEKIEEVKQEWENMRDFIEGTFHELNKLETRKEFALASLKFPFNKFLFAMKDKKQLRTIRLPYEELMTWKGQLP